MATEDYSIKELEEIELNLDDNELIGGDTYSFRRDIWKR